MLSLVASTDGLLLPHTISPITHAYIPPEDTDDRSWPRARVLPCACASCCSCTPTRLATYDRSRPSLCCFFQVFLFYHPLRATLLLPSSALVVSYNPDIRVTTSVRVQVTCTRLGNDRATSHVNMFRYFVSGRFFSRFPCRGSVTNMMTNKETT